MLSHCFLGVFFCWCRVFRHGTELDLFLFLLVIARLFIFNNLCLYMSVIINIFDPNMSLSFYPVAVKFVFNNASSSLDTLSKTSPLQEVGRTLGYSHRLDDCCHANRLS